MNSFSTCSYEWNHLWYTFLDIVSHRLSLSSIPKGFLPACPGVGQEGTGTITFRLDHNAGMYSKYCVEPLVDWGASFERYDRVCQFPVNTDNEISVKYTYTESGTFTTKAKLYVYLTLFRPPHEEQFASKNIEFTVGGGSCARAPTAAPTASPVAGTGGESPTMAPIDSAADNGSRWVRTMILSQFLILLLVNADLV